MGFPGQKVVDALILVGAGSLTLVGCCYVVMMWKLRANFFIVLRSPLLACTWGLCITLRYIATTSEDIIVWDEGEGTVRENGVIDLVGFPALVAALIALVMTAVRLLVMYYPAKRAKWGRYIKEKSLFRALGLALVLMEVAVWSAAWTQGVTTTADWITMVRPWLVLATGFTAVCLGCQMRKIHDSTNLSRDIGLIGRVLAGLCCLFAVVQLTPMPPLAYKYAHVALLTVIHPPLVYIINIRPVQEILRAVPGHRRSTFQELIAPRPTRGSNTAHDVGHSGAGQGRAVLFDSNRLPAIMSLPPLRAAFGEFCRKALCSESFEFLVDVAKFKARAPSSGAGHDEVTLDFARYLAIVNSFIKYDSHSEINISCSTKRDIVDHIKFEAYVLLDPERRKEIFNRAEEEISKLLTYNILGKFLASTEYKAAVDLEESG